MRLQGLRGLNGLGLHGLKFRVLGLGGLVWLRILRIGFYGSGPTGFIGLVLGV